MAVSGYIQNSTTLEVNFISTTEASVPYHYLAVSMTHMQHKGITKLVG